MTTKTPIRPTKLTDTLTPEAQQLIQSRVDALIAERIDRLIAEQVPAVKKNTASGKGDLSLASPVTITREIRTRSRYCPGLAELMSELKTAEVGETIVVISSDPGCRTDIPLWVRQSGNELLAVDNVEGGAVRYIVRKRIRR